jgi:ABC-2 type transport system permease protein
MTALAALTERVIVATLRDQDLLFAILAPVATFVGFTVTLRNLIDTGGMSYPQYVLPAVIVQAMLFGALTTAERAARDQRPGFGVRLRTLPISAAAPLMARMLYCLIRGALALAAAIAVAYLFGFRMTGGLVYTAAFVFIVLLLTLALSLGADATGCLGWKTDAASQLLLVPQLLLVLLSTGMAPINSFPDWLQPFVQYQPVSQVTATLRGFTGGHFVGSNLATSLAWCVGLLVVFGVIAMRMQRRTQ